MHDRVQFDNRSQEKTTLFRVVIGWEHAIEATALKGPPWTQLARK